MIQLEIIAAYHYNRNMEIREYFEINNRAAIAFSGGVDSSYLLYAAIEAGADVTAYYVRSQFQPEFEYRDAVELAQKLGARMRTLSVDVLTDPRVTANPADRCYYCKQNIMTAIRDAARQDGYELICDGTNASDDLGDRPGARALREYGIRSPLRECGLTKSMIRERAKEAGLPVWNKPAYACLATRILTGEEITAEKLRITEQAESLLFSMGFRDFRVRMRGDAALIQVTGEQYEQALSMQEEINKTLAGMYSDITIDDRTR